MSGGTRPNPLSQVLVDRGIRLAAGQAVVIAIPVAVLFYFQFRSLDDLEATSAVVLEQLSSDTADGVAKAIEEALKRPHISVLLGIPQSRIEPPDAEFIAPFLTEGLKESPCIDEFYVWREGEPGSGLGGPWLVFDRASAASSAPAAERFREAPEVAARLVPQFRKLSTLKRAIVAFSDELHGERHYIQAQLRWVTPAREQLSGLVAFAVDASKLRRDYFPALVEARMAQLQQPSGFPPLKVRLADDEGGTVVAGYDVPTPQDERTFPLVFFDRQLLEYSAPYEAHRETWRIQTSYGDAIPAIVSANTRPQPLALRMVGDRGDAEDIAQEVFLKAYRGLQGFRGGSRFYTWLYTIASHHCLNHLAGRDSRARRVERTGNPTDRQGRVLPSALDRVADASPGPYAVLERQELRRMIQNELVQLTEQHRIVLILRDIQGMSYEDIAETLGVELGTVRSRLHRARMELKARLEPLLADRSET